MLIRRFVSFAVAFGILAVGVDSASATTSLRLDPGNTAWSGATTITSTSGDPATFIFVSPNGHMTCSNTSFHVDVASHTSATSITGTLTALTFSSCADSLPVISFTDCRLVPVTGNGAHLSITATSATTSTDTITDARVFCGVAGSTSGCYYTMASASGSGNNLSSSLTFSNLAVSRATSGVTNDLGAACGTSATLGFTLTHIVQTGTNKTVTITNS
jgi:hypothetical protein